MLSYVESVRHRTVPVAWAADVNSYVNNSYGRNRRRCSQSRHRHRCCCCSVTVSQAQTLCQLRHQRSAATPSYASQCSPKTQCVTSAGRTQPVLTWAL